ncbi:MAG TPA: hypothetical protein PL137_10020, partial [Nocardioides sp.]|nr:hypothetical protein [Nocardioides sp.]
TPTNPTDHPVRPETTTPHHSGADITEPKTHLGYRVRQLGPGIYLWRTPHGLYRLVDPTGTHHVAPTSAVNFHSPESDGEAGSSPALPSGP